MDPKSKGSFCKDTHNKDSQFADRPLLGAAVQVPHWPGEERHARNRRPFQGGRFENFTFTWTPKVPKVLAQYSKTEIIGSIGSVVFGILEVQVHLKLPKDSGL